VSVGAYQRGTTPRIDRALDRKDRLSAFLCQPADTLVSYGDAVTALQAL
jgi:flagellar biosynthesis/type III secretory pathway ATPase